MVATKFLTEHPDVVKRILLANLEAIDEVNADPAAAQATVNDEIEKYTTKKLGTDLLAAAWKQPHLHPRPDRVVAPEVGDRRPGPRACSRTRATSRSCTT